MSCHAMPTKVLVYQEMLCTADDRKLLYLAILNCQVSSPWPHASSIPLVPCILVINFGSLGHETRLEPASIIWRFMNIKTQHTPHLIQEKLISIHLPIDLSIYVYSTHATNTVHASRHLCMRMCMCMCGKPRQNSEPKIRHHTTHHTR